MCCEGRTRAEKEDKKTHVRQTFVRQHRRDKKKVFTSGSCVLVLAFGVFTNVLRPLERLGYLYMWASGTAMCAPPARFVFPADVHSNLHACGVSCSTFAVRRSTFGVSRHNIDTLWRDNIPARVSVYLVEYTDDTIHNWDPWFVRRNPSYTA